MLKKIKDLLRFFLPANKSSRYLDFVVTHHKDDSLIRMAKNSQDGIYEMAERDIMTTILKRSTHPVMLDIGANIGLMSLNIAAQVENVSIYAFEPGPKQFAYLKNNIGKNGVEKTVHIFNIALGGFTGLTDFVVHHAKDSSGDGILDTGRAGNSKVIKVPSQTLDGWWQANGKPKVTLIKLDTEGSELIIMQHAKQLIDQCKPSILIEICYLNFEKYGLTFQQHLDFFDDANYNVLDIKTNDRLIHSSAARADQFYYLAVPK